MLSFLPSHGRQNNTSRCKVPFHMQWVYSCIIHCSDDSSSESEDPSLSAAVVYETPAAIYSAETIMKILLNPTSSRVSRVCPHCVTKSSTYVVDVTSLAHPEDVKKDDFGKWDYKGSHPVAFHVCFRNDGSICIERCQNEERQGDIFYLRWLYSTHPSNPEMKRMLALSQVCWTYQVWCSSSLLPICMCFFFAMPKTVQALPPNLPMDITPYVMVLNTRLLFRMGNISELLSGCYLLNSACKVLIF